MSCHRFHDVDDLPGTPYEEGGIALGIRSETAAVAHRRWLLASRVLLAFQSALLAGLISPASATAQGNELTEQAVVETITNGRKSLISRQLEGGTWDSSGHVVGNTCLATLALLNCGMKADDLPIRKALAYLRSIPEPQGTYEASLALMVYATVKDQDDARRMRSLVRRLEAAQIDRGKMKGCWSYNTDGGLIDTGGDHSNGQFAVLGLFEAAMAGIAVEREVWQRARDHWELAQSADGGWGYAAVGGNSSTGSMTVAGIAVQVMTSAMLQQDDKLDADGNPQCCANPEIDESLERGVRWMANHFSVARNPGGGGWKYYYLYGLERAGRLSGRRFFGESDWYRSGARQLIGTQNRRTYLWEPAGNATDEITATSFALLFLSKGLAPVLINKLKFGLQAKVVDEIEDWNHQPNDIRNLTARLTGAEGWPKLMTWQIVDLTRASDDGSVGDLNQAPVLYLSGANRPEFTPKEIELLREYVNLGGFILAVNSCGTEDFRAGFNDLVDKMYANGETSLQRLTAEHPVFRTEYLLDADSSELWGAEFGCRTAIMYSPNDLGCLWNRWAKLDPPDRPAQFRGRIERAMRVGTNIITYATGREPVNKLRRQELAAKQDDTSAISRGLIQVAQIRHTGGWDTAPTAARNILTAVNRTVGLTASTKPATVLLSDKSLFDYSMLVMHGRHQFTTTAAEREQLREYLGRGRLLMADACCGARQFDGAFREFMKQLYPDRKLQRIPVDHELFTDENMHDLRQVERRVTVEAGNATIEGGVVRGEPFLEGIEIDGRYVVIYSKYDISCALERQASIACAGYVTDDAVRIAVNILLYSMLRKGEIAASR
ncbi:MAG: DUF4159 domain-containing protein [Planctomycetota bacterium]|nr:DUF4159 domain-containing protein [Planctomycetota bacterium]